MLRNYPKQNATDIELQQTSFSVISQYFLLHLSCLLYRYYITYLTQYCPHFVNQLVCNTIIILTHVYTLLTYIQLLQIGLYQIIKPQWTRFWSSQTIDSSYLDTLDCLMRTACGLSVLKCNMCVIVIYMISSLFAHSWNSWDANVVNMFTLRMILQRWGHNLLGDTFCPLTPYQRVNIY